MAKATPKKQNNRADPISKKGKTKTKAEAEVQVGDAKTAKVAKNPKDSHLYTDDNPETTLQGTGFKDEATAQKTISLVSKRSLTYQWQTINTMYNRAKHHPKKTKDMEAAIAVFSKWLNETYKQEKAAQRVFKPVPKKTIELFLPDLKRAKDVDTTFAELYVKLEPRKKLANVLVNDKEPGEADWDKARVDALSQLVPNEENDVGEDDLWDEDGSLSVFHMKLLSWAWTPLSDYKLRKEAGKA